MALTGRQPIDKDYADAAGASATSAAASARAAATSSIDAASSATDAASSATDKASSSTTAAASARAAATSTLAARGPVNFDIVLSTTTSEKVLARFKPKQAGKIVGLDATAIRSAVTTDKEITIGVTISDVPVSGGTLNVATTAGAVAVGGLISGSEISGAASYSAGQSVLITCRSAAAQHAEGEIMAMLFLGEQ